jgi:hypothetical protein
MVWLPPTPYGLYIATVSIQSVHRNVTPFTRLLVASLWVEMLRSCTCPGSFRKAPGARLGGRCEAQTQHQATPVSRVLHCWGGCAAFGICQSI